MNQELGTKKKENTSKFCKAKLEAFSFFLLFIFLVFTIFSFWSSVAYAAPAPAASQPVSLPNPLGISSPQVLLGRAAKALTGISGSLALVMFIYGGLTWLTAGGSPERIKKGKDILVWAVIGLAIMFSAYIVVRYVLTALTRGVVNP